MKIANKNKTELLLILAPDCLLNSHFWNLARGGKFYRKRTLDSSTPVVLLLHGSVRTALFMSG